MLSSFVLFCFVFENVDLYLKLNNAHGLNTYIYLYQKWVMQKYIWVKCFIKKTVSSGAPSWPEQELKPPWCLNLFNTCYEKNPLSFCFQVDTKFSFDAYLHQQASIPLSFLNLSITFSKSLLIEFSLDWVFNQTVKTFLKATLFLLFYARQLISIKIYIFNQIQ